MGFVGNLALFVAVKGFCKSIKNWQSYSHGYGGTGTTLVWLTVHRASFSLKVVNFCCPTCTWVSMPFIFTVPSIVTQRYTFSTLPKISISVLVSNSTGWSATLPTQDKPCGTILLTGRTTRRDTLDRETGWHQSLPWRYEAVPPLSTHTATHAHTHAVFRWDMIW